MHGYSKGQVPVDVRLCCNSMDRAVKTMSIYAGRSYRVQETLIDFHRHLEDALEATKSMLFEVTPWGLTWHGTRIHHDEKPSPYYYELFKDGVREVTFLRGVTRQEVEAFVRVLVLQVHLKDEAIATDEVTEIRDQDTVTRLWEADLKHITWYAVDAYATGEVLDPERGELQRVSVEVRREQEAFAYDGRLLCRGLLAAKSTGPITRGRAVEITAPAGPTDTEIAENRLAIAHDESLEKERFAEAWAVMARGSHPDDHAALAGLMIGTMRAWLDTGNWNALLRVQRILRELFADENLKGLVRQVVKEGTAGPELMRLHTAVAQATPSEVARCLTFFEPLGKSAYRALVQMLRELSPGPTLQAFERGLAGIGWDLMPLHLARLRARNLRAIGDAMRKLTLMRRNPGIADALRPFLEHGESAVRVEAMQALEGDQHPATIKALISAMTDESPQTRHFAIGAMGRARWDGAREALKERLDSRAFHTLDMGERRLLLATFAKLGGEPVWAWFSQQLGRSSIFRERQAQAWRAELRHTLEQAGSPGARTVLDAEGKA